ncbi:MAG: toxin-antitoxin system, toxin component, MazF family protein [Lactobacillaceae bacterium]|jgi:hypothetical protein|nr:toxin-antitoxin system, toxin component, MazF family protein [Lactobacillaceae bacterium]
MKSNDVVSVYIAYSDIHGGKRRPVLVVKLDEKYIYVLRITTKFANKSPQIQANYFKIDNWREAGLNQLSYIDVGEVEPLLRSKFENQITSIGSLHQADRVALIEFIQNR